MSLLSFYYSSDKNNKQQLELTKSELYAVGYIQIIYHLGIDIVDLKNLYMSNAKESVIHAMQENINRDIDSIFALQEEYPKFINTAFNDELQKMRNLDFNNTQYLEFLDLINHENYRIGDVSSLLFEANREVYFLGTLLTHYMPEYILSLLLSDSFIKEFYYKGSLSQEKKNLYIEQNKLVYLSSKEVAGIIKLLTPNKEVKKLSLIMQSLLKKLEHIEEEKTAVSDWKKDSKEFERYSAYAKEVKSLSIFLNDKYIEILTKSLEEREKLLNDEIVKNNIIIISLFIFISIISFYFYRTKILNVSKEEEIEKINHELDNVVLFSKSDKNGNIIHVSSALLRLSGYTKEELIGKNHRIFKSDENPKELYKDLWKTITKKEVWKGELINKHKDGSTYWTYLTITPELDRDGNIVAYNASRIDITDEKKLEGEKLRTQEALEFKSKFLSNMSHEIRTPLNAIIGLLNVALKTDLDVKQKDLLSKVTLSSDMLLSIINDILDISKIEAGKMKLEKTAFNLIELLETLEKLMSEKVLEKKLSLNLHYHDIKAFHFLGDSLRIAQVLNNLVSNAIKFTQNGTIDIDIRMMQNTNIRFEVKDSGIGLKEQEMEILFEDFMQADMSTSRKYGGTGLGLSICKQLVTLMNGEIWVQSVYGEGSTFVFEIPLESNEDDMQDKEQEDGDLKRLENKVNTIEDKKILIAEDNKMNRLVVSMLLEDSQIELDFAHDGSMAVEKFKTNTYDMIFMDIQMPNMNGYEATKNIRLSDKDIPIIALSANVMQEDMKKAEEAGMNAYLAKPIDITKFYNIIVKYIFQ